MAPNLVTFVGWLFMISSYLVMLYYDYTFKQEIPRWTFFFAALCIFIYTNLDAMDGKQARRTKSSSPLGQLFDHGCDSFSLNFFVLAVCEAAQLEREQVFVIFVSAQVAFWTSNWIEYHTGVLQTSVGNFGVTESEIICMLVHILTGIFGQKMWAVSLDFMLPTSVTSGLYASYPMLQSIFSMSAKQVISYTLAGILTLVSLISFGKMIKGNQESKLGMFLEWLGVILIVGMEFIWIGLPIYDMYNGIILANFGIVTSLLVCKVIIISVTKMKLHFFHKELIPCIISTIVLLRYHYKGNTKGMVMVFWACLVLNIITAILFLTVTIRQITQYLGIQCFSLKKVPRKLE